MSPAQQANPRSRGGDFESTVADARRFLQDLRLEAGTAEMRTRMTGLAEKSPYQLVLGAAGVGFVLAGGLTAPVTRALLGITVRTLAVEPFYRAISAVLNDSTSPAATTSTAEKETHS